MPDLKDEIKEIVEIVELVPDALKPMCFEMLLKEALASRRAPPPLPVVEQQPPLKPANSAPARQAPLDPPHNNGIDGIGAPAPGIQPKISDGSDIALSDLHMKTRKFMDKNGLTIEHLNNLLYKNDGKFEWLISDLGVTGMAEGQFRICALQCLHNALSTGDFETTIEAVREECKMRKCYDQANFTGNIRNKADSFDFGTWSKEIVTLRLSDDGRKALAEAIKTYK